MAIKVTLQSNGSRYTPDTQTPQIKANMAAYEGYTRELAATGKLADTGMQMWLDRERAAENDKAAEQSLNYANQTNAAWQELQDKMRGSAAKDIGAAYAAAEEQIYKDICAKSGLKYSFGQSLLGRALKACKPA